MSDDQKLVVKIIRDESAFLPDAKNTVKKT